MRNGALDIESVICISPPPYIILFRVHYNPTVRNYNFNLMAPSLRIIGVNSVALQRKSARFGFGVPFCFINRDYPAEGNIHVASSQTAAPTAAGNC